MQQSADRAKHVDRADDQRTPARQNSDEAKRFPGAEENRYLTGEIRETRQAAAGKCGHHEDAPDERQPPPKPAQLIHLQRARLLVNITVEANVSAARKPWATITITAPVIPIRLRLAIPRNTKPICATLE